MRCVQGFTMINAMYALKSNIVGTVYPYTQIPRWKPNETKNVRDALYNAHISKGKRECSTELLVWYENIL